MPSCLIIVAAGELDERPAELEKGKMMKNPYIWLRKFIVVVILCSFGLWLSGCSRCMPPFGDKGCAQPGETEAEGHRRHLRNARINHQLMMADIDRAMLFDKPLKASPQRTP